MNTVRVRFVDSVNRKDLTLDLPGDTRFSQLTAILVDREFLVPQKPGFRYLYRNHMCGMGHTLADYLPPEATSMELEIFRYPQVLV